MSDGKKPHGLFTLIFKKMPGGWKIVMLGFRWNLWEPEVPVMAPPLIRKG